MTFTPARLAFYVLSLVLALIPASWATHGITYDGTSLHLHLEALVSAGTITLLSALGLSGAVYGLWGDGGPAGLESKHPVRPVASVARSRSRRHGSGGDPSRWGTVGAY